MPTVKVFYAVRWYGGADKGETRLQYNTEAEAIEKMDAMRKVSTNKGTRFYVQCYEVWESN